MPKQSKHGSRATNASSDRTPASSPPKSASELTGDALELVRQMLMYLDPQAAFQLPIDAPENVQVPVPISQWNVLYSAPVPAGPIDPLKSSIRVLSYPTPGKNLFCVRSVVPGINARQFWTLMAESGNRHMWDSTVQEGGNWRWCEQELKNDHTSANSHDRRLARSIAARLEYLKLGSIFMVAKPRDMVLLSADVQLPPTDESPLRLVSSCRSEVDPGKPPLKGYTRFQLGTGGFMVEELGDDGLSSSTKHAGKQAIRVTQLSDLGEMASWVPSSVVRMVAQSLVPRSLALIAKAAANIKIPAPLRVSHVSEDVNLHDEDVVRGAERWSKARGLPSLVGQGVLARPGVEAAATTVSESNSGNLSQASPSAAADLTPVQEESNHPPAQLPPHPATDDDEAMEELNDNLVSLPTTASHSPVRARERPSLSRNASTEEPPLLSLTLQRLSTQLREDSPPPLSPSQQHRLAMQGYFASPNTDHRSPGAASSVRGDYFAGRSTASGSTASPWGTGSDTGSYMTFGVPSGERTVPGSLNDADEGTRFPFESSGAGSSARDSTSMSQGSHSSQQAHHQDDEAGDDTLVMSKQQADDGHSGSGSEAATPASKDTTPSSRSSRQEELRFRDAAELDKRLLRISKALHTVDQAEGTGSALTSSPVPQSRLAASIDEHPGRSTYHDGFNSDEDDGHDEVDDLLAEALSMSLSAPKLRRHFSPGSPVQDLYGFGSSSRRGFSPPPLPRSPPSKAARREASELSAILLAGSDALVSVLAPGARDTLAAGEDADEDEGKVGLGSPTLSASAFCSISSPSVSSPTSAHAFRHFFSGTSDSSLNGTISSTPTQSSPFATSTTQVSSAHALRQPSYFERGTTSYSSNMSGLADLTEPSGQTSQSQSRRRTNPRTWKGSLTGLPYALALGTIAMVWARGGRKEPIDDVGDDETRPSLSSASPSAYAGAARQALLRTMSSDGRGSSINQRRLHRATMNRSVSSPYHSSSKDRRQSGNNAITNSVIPAESSNSRRLTRENYMGNTKLLTSHRKSVAPREGERSGC